ncbi:N-acetylglucosamine-6-phosphate deacetylase [Rheinheimera sp.]|uniref:N-acetylglucosamine-6-phosphate deacetylase n=1 Tax=Rheinheimera sp. TaxID=1869214 RepID=UPI00307E4C7D
MTDAFYLTAPKLLRPTGFSTGWLRIEQGRIAAIEANPKADLPQIQLPSGLLCPGFIDVQVNGGGGELFNTNPSLACLRQMMAAHRPYGTTAMLPTVITDDLAVMQQAADAVAEAIRLNEPGILGIHFEGPHLSEAKRGCHPLPFLRPLSDAELALYSRQDLGVVMLTLAPEAVPAEQIRQLVDAGVIVALGHSNATSAQVLAALDAGASGFTHLYNGMSNLTSREPGMVGTALADGRAYCGLILDGEHLHPLSARLAYQAKGAERLVLVTDAMSPVGTNQSEFVFAGGRVSRQGMKLTNAAGSLAGSVLDMQAAVIYAITQLAVPPVQALQMASLTPAQWLQQTNRGLLQPGAVADLLWLNEQYQVQQSWIAGQTGG